MAALAAALAQGLVTNDPISLRDILTGAGSLLAALLGLAGIVYTARSARGANSRTAAVEQYKAETERWKTQVESWRADAQTLRSDMAEDRRHFDEQLGKLQTRVREVEEQATSDRLARIELVQWARTVIAILRRANLMFPPPPASVSDSGGHQAVSPREE